MTIENVFEVGAIDIPDIGKVRFEQGVTVEKYKQLYQKSQQQFMLEWAEEDERLRFCQPSKGAEKLARDQHNFMITAVTEEQDIAGVALCINENTDVEGSSHEIVTRVYDGYRQRGIGRYLLNLVHDISDAASIKSTYFYTLYKNQVAFELGMQYRYRIADSENCKGINPAKKLVMVRK